MLSVKEAAIVYETLLSSPGMADPVKLHLNIPRKHILILSRIIELGLSVQQQEGQVGLLNVVDKTTTEELRGLAEDILSKAGLTDMNEKLNTLQPKEK